MKFEMIAVYDSKVKIYGRPLFLPTLDMVDRYAQRVLADADSDIARWPADYTLFHLGTYDDSDGSIELLSTPHSLLRFHEVRLNLAEVASNVV